jgi:broad specificity phosphatase PhoE
MVNHITDVARTLPSQRALAQVVDWDDATVGTPDWPTLEMRQLLGRYEKEFVGLFGEDWPSDKDVPLTDNGIHQSKRAGDQLLQHQFCPDIVYQSTLSRVRMTRQKIAEVYPAFGQFPLRTDRRLDEQNHGDFHDHLDKFLWFLTHPEELVRYRREKFQNYRYPRGESFMDVVRRADAWLDHLSQEHPGQRIFAVTSHNVICAIAQLMAHHNGFALPKESTHHGTVINNAHFVRFVRGNDGKFQLTAYNDSDVQGASSIGGVARGDDIAHSVHKGNGNGSSRNGGAHRAQDNGIARGSH